MRTTCLFALFAAFLATSAAQTDKSLQSKIISATVYSDRALVTRSASGSFPAGKYSVKIPGLPLQLNDQSVRVTGEGTAHASILEVRVEMGLLDSIPDTRVKELQARLKAVQDEIRKVNDRAAILAQQKDFLGRISIASSDNISKDLRVQRPTIDDWQKTLTFLDANQSRLNAAQSEIDSQKEELQKKNEAIQFDLNSVGISRQPREKYVVVGLDVTQEGKLDLAVSYLVQNASWQPSYDLHAYTGDKKIDITYNAQVWQSTGEDWKDVTLTLSSAQPVVGGNQPTLSPWFVDVYGGTRGAIQGFVRDRSSGEPIVGASVAIAGTSQRATTNADGFFLIQDIQSGECDIRASSAGYGIQTIHTRAVAYQSTRVDVLLDAVNIEKEGIVTTAERPIIVRSATNSVRIVSGDDTRATGFETSRLQAGATSAAFEIGSKTTIPCNNTKRKVTISVASLPGDFKYSSVPKIQPRVYFKSNVTNTTDFPFLDGPMSVFVDNSYVSNSHLPTVMPGEKFDAYLGVDDGIRIERKILNKLTETSGLFSKTQKTTYDVLIKVENVKKTEETISIRDNIPVSRNEKIQVEIETPKEKELQPDAEGFLTWNLQLKPGEKEEIKIKYSVEYPTDMTVTALD